MSNVPSLPPLPAPEPENAGTEPAPATRSGLADGEWHRLHPLTPLFRGGLAIVVVAGIIIANLRERIIEFFLPMVAPDLPAGEDYPGDPVDYIIDNNLIVIVLLGAVVLAAILVGLFYLSWRFHTFRITHDDVEVRSGVLFRSHRRAPLDRVQGVNLTRPMIARLCGMAKLEVIGAGQDSNVKLEYLSTTNAEAVRADILRLASGRRLDPSSARAATRNGSLVATAASTVSDGISGLIAGAEGPVDEPESVVAIPIGRLVASRVLSSSTLALVLLVGAIVAGSIYGSPWVLFGMIPALLAFGAYWLRSTIRALRYSIAPTANGVRITFGLFTTITEILPPGRVHAIEVAQSILWRPAGWWSVRVNRLSGRSATDTRVDQFATVLPVGTRADVERVLRLLLPNMPESEWPVVFEHGILGPRADDPYVNTPRSGRWLRPLSWRRNGYLIAPDALFLRRGVVWRSLGIFPLARLQSVALTQGPVGRMLGLASARADTIAGPVNGRLGSVGRDAAVQLFAEVTANAIQSAARDTTHRWSGFVETAEEPTASSSADPSPVSPDPSPASADPSRPSLSGGGE